MEWSEKRKALRQKQLEDSVEDSGSTGDDRASAVLERSKGFIESILDEDETLPKGIFSRLSDAAEKGISASTTDLLGKMVANRSGSVKMVEVAR